MNKSAITLALSLLISPVLPLNAQAQSAITEQEAHDIGVNAYLYFYSLLSMDITRKQSTNIEPGKEFGKGPMNMFVNIPEYPPADYKGVVRPNFDTLYSIAWLDMTKEPVVISVPDTGGRYYLLPMLDMWSDVFASPGWRTTGTQAGTFLVTPPGWRGQATAFSTGTRCSQRCVLTIRPRSRSDWPRSAITAAFWPTRRTPTSWRRAIRSTSGRGASHHCAANCARSSARTAPE